MEIIYKFPAKSDESYGSNLSINFVILLEKL